MTSLEPATTVVQSSSTFHETVNHPAIFAHKNTSPRPHNPPPQHHNNNQTSLTYPAYHKQHFQRSQWHPSSPQRRLLTTTLQWRRRHHRPRTQRCPRCWCSAAPARSVGRQRSSRFLVRRTRCRSSTFDEGQESTITTFGTQHTNKTKTCC
jgi:hypothetical protein